MKRGTEQNAVLRDNRKVVSSIDSFAFLVLNPFAAPVSAAVFLCLAHFKCSAHTTYCRPV